MPDSKKLSGAAKGSWGGVVVLTGCVWGDGGRFTWTLPMHSKD